MKTIINIKADRDVKEQAVRTAKKIGIPLSTVINAFLKKFIDEKSVTFTAPFRPTKGLEKLLRKAEKDIKTGRNLSPVFTSVDALMEDLLH